MVRGTDTYGSTAVIAVEAARRLAVDGAPPGVLAPAQAFDPADFLRVLAGHGIITDEPDRVRVGLGESSGSSPSGAPGAPGNVESRAGAAENRTGSG